MDTQAAITDQRDKHNQRKHATHMRVIAAIMEQSDGREFMYDYLEGTRMFGNPMVQGDTHATYFNLGMQNSGKLIFKMVEEGAPEMYFQMMQEALARDKADNKALDEIYNQIGEG